ncbi:hypothetical protein C4587_01270 [Candidatus Parcubacteria bacterium]|nr:MAG: hypothetical protein C4587_01270 [Candidatus Parcubacteria bacterium]
MKRILIIAVPVLVVAAILGAVYFSRGVPQEGGQPPSPVGGLPGIPGGAPADGTAGETLPGGGLAASPTDDFGRVSDVAARSFFVNEDNSVTILQPDGRIARISGGELTTLSASLIVNLFRADFSHDGKKILAVFGSRETPQVSVFDTEARTWQPIGIESATAVSWSRTDYRIAFLTAKGGTGELNILDLGNPKAKIQKVADIRFYDGELHWISPDEVVLTERGAALVRSSAWKLNLKTKVLVPLALDQLGLDALWEEEGGGRGLVFTGTRRGLGGELYFQDKEGNLRRMSILTLPSKCAFGPPPGKAPEAATSSAPGYFYCATPIDPEILDVTPLPDAYFKEVFRSSDSVLRVDPNTGLVLSLLPDSAPGVDASNLQVSAGRLFFINRLDGRIYALKLPEEN